MSMVTVVPTFCSAVGEAVEQRNRQRFVEGKPELGQLDRDVGLEALGADPVEPFDVLVPGTDRSGTIVALLTEEVERHEETVPVELASGSHTLIEVSLPRTSRRAPFPAACR